jgi:hypothetical protein
MCGCQRVHAHMCISYTHRRMSSEPLNDGSPLVAVPIARDHRVNHYRHGDGAAQLFACRLHPRCIVSVFVCVCAHMQTKKYVHLMCAVYIYIYIHTHIIIIIIW